MASIKKDKITGKWFCRVSYKDANGKYRTKTKKGFSTKLEATLYAGDLEKSKQKNSDLSCDKDLSIFSVYFEEWCHTYAIGKFSVGTDNKYLHEIELVKNFFGIKPISEITRLDYQKYINKRGKDRSRNTVEKTHGYLKRCFSYAIADGLITVEPSFGAVLTYDKEEQDRVKHLNEADAIKLLNFVTSDHSMNNLMIHIALTTGLRIGEIYGLSYEDFTPTTISVNRGYDYRDTNDFTRGKTKSSIRTITITPTLYQAVTTYHQNNDTPYLFLDNKANPKITHTGISKYFKNTLKHLDIPTVTFHVLRHTHASILFAKNINIGYISKRLGHANISETLKTYTHIINELEQKQNEAIVDIFTQMECK